MSVADSGRKDPRDLHIRARPCSLCQRPRQEHIAAEASQDGTRIPLRHYNTQEAATVLRTVTVLCERPSESVETPVPTAPRRGSLNCLSRREFQDRSAEREKSAARRPEKMCCHAQEEQRNCQRTSHRARRCDPSSQGMPAMTAASPPNTDTAQTRMAYILLLTPGRNNAPYLMMNGMEP